jgi:AcrR family transcriptional regulator
LFEALLRTNLDALTQKAVELETSNPPDDALVSWFREGVAFVDSYRGVVALMASAHADPDSALYAPCTAVRSAGARLLLRAQAEGTARADMDADDLFALMSALGWLVGQPGFAPRGDRLFHIVTSAILTNPSSNDVKTAAR